MTETTAKRMRILVSRADIDRIEAAFDARFDELEDEGGQEAEIEQVLALAKRLRKAWWQ